jgi:hypothetical protein
MGVMLTIESIAAWGLSNWQSDGIVTENCEIAVLCDSKMRNDCRKLISFLGRVDVRGGLCSTGSPEATVSVTLRF